MTSTTSPDLVVDSVTGVEVALPVAGPGARSFAFLIDWLIRGLIAAAWYLAGAAIYNGAFRFIAPPKPGPTWFLLVVLPTLAIYFLYHGVLEVAMRGRTPGKRIAGVRLVSRHGGPPGVGALVTRNVFRLVDSLPGFYGVGLLTTFLTQDHVRVGDLASGTLLVYDRTNLPLLEHVGTPALGTLVLDASTAEIVSELLTRWPSLEPGSRQRLARVVLLRFGYDPADPQLGEDAALRSALERLARQGLQ